MRLKGLTKDWQYNIRHWPTKATSVYKCRQQYMLCDGVLQLSLQTTCCSLLRQHLRGVSQNWLVLPAEKAFEECATLETKVQLLQKAAFGDVDVEKGLAAFHVSLHGPSFLHRCNVLDAQSMQVKRMAVHSGHTGRKGENT